MSMSDPIADMLTRVRNGQMARKQSVACPNSGAKRALLRVLLEEGYIEGFSESDDKRELEVRIKYYAGRPVMESVARKSRPGLRRYAGARDLRPVKNGLGVAVVSTSRGVMSDAKARELGVGGEILCEVF